MGGAELFALRLARHLHRESTEVAVLTGSPSAFATQIAAAEVRVVDHPLPALRARHVAVVPGAVMRTRSMLKAARRTGAVVLANTSGAQAYTAVAAALVRHPPPLVHLVHEQMTAARPTARAAFRRYGAVVATGANSADVYRTALPGVRIGQLNNFLDVQAFEDAAPADCVTRPTVGILGRMIPAKGILEAVGELAAARELWSSARIAAPPQDPAYGASVRRRIDDLGLTSRIEVLDWVEPLPFIDAVDVLLVPSTGQEGQPTVILEALAHQRPVVVRAPVWSTDFEGLPVQIYRGTADLGDALENPPPWTAEAVAEVRRRFGPEQAVSAIQLAVDYLSSASVMTPPFSAPS